MNSLSPKASLLSTQIHVYCRDLSISSKDIHLLDETERDRAEKFKFEHHRNRFIAAHTVLHEILISYLHENPVILKSSHGKPYLRDYPEIQFNLSHSENIALYAISKDIPVGIDVEYNLKSHDIMGIAERFFSPEEFGLIKISENPQKLFFQLWTRKEAYLKLKGHGISEGLDQKIPDEFIIHDFIPTSDYTAALVLPRVLKQIVYFGIKF